MIAAVGMVSSWGFHLRITDTEGKPFDDLEYVLAAEVLGRQAKGEE